MNDIQKMCGNADPAVMEGETALLTGSAPVDEMNGYQKEVLSYSRGAGRVSLCI